jgi:endonuclease/exonuclease/phosphatase family metal-dependent hydrolase
MLTFVFWNLGGPTAEPPGLADGKRIRRVHQAVANLARHQQVDVMILAEFPGTTEDLLMELNAGNSHANITGFRNPNPRSQCERIVILTRFPVKYLPPIQEGIHHTARRLCLPKRRELLLVALHLPSKLFRSEHSQALDMPWISSLIRGLERAYGHENTVLVGDFNMNPFEPGMIGAKGLNATMTRDIAHREERTVDAERCPFFYNPMWGHFGDASHEEHPPGSNEHEPPGTCYFPAKEAHWYYWNMFDQVLLRPGLLPCFRNRDLRIVVSDGTQSLLTERGLPNRALFSDHLPILFRLDI